MFFVRALFFYLFFAGIGGLSFFDRFVVRAKKDSPTVIKLRSLLKQASDRGFFSNQLSACLDTKKDVDFWKEWKKLPIFTKHDYLNIKLNNLYPKVSDNVLVAYYQLLTGKFSYTLATGGSSKVPLSVTMDKEHAFKMAFSFFRCWYKMGWRPGHKILIFYPDKIYDLEIFKHYQWLFDLLGLRFHTFSNIEQSVDEFVDVLNTYRPDTLIIFPSPLNILSNQISKRNLSVYNPKMINVSGETLFKCQRDNITKVFNQSLLEDSYGSVELGEIAHEVETGVLEVFDHHAFVETIESNGKYEILVTIFGNGYFPFIRYRMGDIMNVFEKGGKQYLSDINGKPTNKTTIGNVTVYPRDLDRFITNLNSLPDQFPLIVDVRLIKGPENIKLSLIAYKHLDVGAIQLYSVRIRNAFYETFGIHPEVSFVDVFKHDYRLKYRALVDESEEYEWAGGIIGQAEKMRL